MWQLSTEQEHSWYSCVPVQWILGLNKKKPVLEWEQSQWWLLGIWTSWRLMKIAISIWSSEQQGQQRCTVYSSLHGAQSRPAHWLEFQFKNFIGCGCQCCWCASWFRSSWGRVSLLAVYHLFIIIFSVNIPLGLTHAWSSSRQHA